MGTIKQRLANLEAVVVVEDVTIKLRPSITPEKWLILHGGKDIDAEPLTVEQQEWVDSHFVPLAQR